jgi:hypothetical protein
MPPHALALGAVLLVIILVIALTPAGRSKPVPARVVLKNGRR